MGKAYKACHLQCVIPQGGYFVLVNMAKLQIPEDFQFPGSVSKGAYDLKVNWFIIHTVGVVAIPTSVFYTTDMERGFTRAVPKAFLRYSVAKSDTMLRDAVDWLLLLRQYIAT
jgi:kynurenine aminotransferase